jgi:hypothetical protein
MKKSTILKFVAVVVLCVMLDIILHLVTSDYSTMPENPHYSILAELLGPGIIATLWAMLAFSGAAYVYYRVRYNIPGVGIKQGLRYGGAIALLWLFAMLEGVSLFGNPVINEFIVGLSDAIPVLLMGTLLGLLLGKKTGSDEPGSQTFNQKLLTVGVFSAIFTLGRYAAYFTGIIQSGYLTSPLITLLWTILMGACIGIVYVLLGQTGKTISLKRRAVTFGFVIFGINWAVFLIFMPSLFSGFLVDVLARITIDILLVTVGCYLSSTIRINRFQEVNIHYSKKIAEQSN